jgi:hypothetical protein
MVTTVYTGFVTDILDDLKTDIEGNHAAWKVFFGPISEGEFFAIDKPAVSIQFNGATADVDGARNWHFDVSLIYLKYDPKFTDDYDCLDDVEALMNEVEDHLEAQNIAGLNFGGELDSVNVYRHDHEDSFVFMAEIKLKLNRLEV